MTDTAHGTHTPGRDRNLITVFRQAAAAGAAFDALPDLIECAEILRAQCIMDADLAHANMYQARAERGRAALAKAEGRT